MRVARSKVLPVSGAQLRCYYFIENEDGVISTPNVLGMGRNSGFNFADQYPVAQISEIGNDGVDERAYTQHSGTFSQQAFYGIARNFENSMPNRDEHRDSFLDLPYFTIKIVISGGAYTGLWTDEFRHCRITNRDGSISPRGVMMGNLRGEYAFHNRNTELDTIVSVVVDDIPSTVA